MGKPRLSTDQIKKLLVTVIAMAALLYGYQAFFLAPLMNSQQRMKSATADYENKLVQAESTIKEVQRLESSAGDSVSRLKRLQALNPAGAPVAWFPPLTKSFFAADQIETGLIRLIDTTPLPEPGMEAYRRTDWTIEIPKSEFALLGSSIARLENDGILSAIRSIRIHALQEDPQFQSVTIGMERIVKQSRGNTLD